MRTRIACWAPPRCVYRRSSIGDNFAIANGLNGYESQPGNQGGNDNGNSLEGYEGRPGNQADTRSANARAQLASASRGFFVARLRE